MSRFFSSALTGKASILSNARHSSHAVGWQPRVALRAGLAKTIEYYRAHLSAYLDEPSPTPSTVA